MPLSGPRKQRVNVIQQRCVRRRVPTSAAGTTMATQVNCDQGDSHFRERLANLFVLSPVLTESVKHTHHTQRSLIRPPLASEQAKPIPSPQLNLSLLQSTIPNNRSVN